MKTDIKLTNFSFVMLYVIAIVMAVLGRIGIAILDGMGGVAYDYISISSGTLFEQLLSIFSGAQLYGFMCAMALLCCVLLASAIMHGFAYAQDPEGASLGKTFLAALLTTLVAFLCLIIPVSGLFSGVQLWGLKIAAPVTGAVIGMGLIAFLAIVALEFAVLEVIYFCIARAHDGKSLWVTLLVAAAICGFIVVLLTVFVFTAMNEPPINAAGGTLWFSISLVVNLVIGFVAKALTGKKTAA